MRISIRIPAVVALTILLAAAGANAQITAGEKAEVDKLFDTWNKDDSPGAAVGVIRDGKLIYSKGYGMADLEHDVPLTPDSVFYAASVSKQFVTMAVLLLEEQGKLELDDEIQKYLPDFPRYEGKLTIRNFIHHTSGVRDSLTLWNLAGRDIYDHIPKEAMYELLKRQKELNFTPGEQYLYSNACYFMLAMIVEKVSGQTIREFADEQMFKPLGMKDTHFHDDMYHIVKNRAFSYSPSPNGYRNLIMRFDLVGSGGLYTTVNDLYLWDQNFYDNKLGKGGPELIRKMQEDGRLNSGESAGYAFGLQNGSHKGLKTVEHGGSLAGYRTYLIRYPEQNFSVIVLANVSGFNSGGKAREVAEVFLKDRFIGNPEPVRTSGGGEEKPSVTLTEAELRPFVGKYFDRETGIVLDVTLENGGLMFQRDETPKVPMVAVSRNSFRVNDPPVRLVATFDLRTTGRPMLSADIEGGPTLKFEAYTPASYGPRDLERFAGRYYSEEVDAFYELKVKAGQLELHVAGLRRGTLKPVKAGLFRSDDFGYFEFADPRKGFALEAGRVRNLKFVRQ